MPDVGAAQRDSQKFIVFTNWEKMNTKLQRVALPENQLAWLENLQPVGNNNLVPVPSANPPLTNITSAETVLVSYFANIASIDYAIVFTKAGAGIAVNLVTGAQTLFAPDGTFTAPDMTVFASQRILIADPTAGYTTWDGSVFVASGGVSPNITVTNGGTTAYTSVPTVAVTGGAGTGVAAHAMLDGSGFVVKVILDNAGTGYKPGDTLTVTFTGGGGAGAAASARVWPNIGLQTTPTTQGAKTIAVFAGRVWLGNRRVLSFTGTAGYDDNNAANAAGSVTFADADLSHEITALRTLNNYLFIFGDQSVRQIGSVLISSGNITLFTPFVLASDIGTSFKQTILSYNRLVLFANKNGVYAIFGASVEKISDDLDGIFSGPTTPGSTLHSNIDFSLIPQAALVDLRNVHCYLLLVRYVDPVSGPRSIVLAFQDKQWFVISQGALVSIVPVFLASTQQWEVFGSSGTDVTLLLQDTSTAVPIKLVTALTPHQNPVQAKQALRAGVASVTETQQVLNLAIESEYTSRTYQLTLAVDVFWINYQTMVVTWTNSSGGVVQWFAQGGFRFPYTSVDGLGKFLGATITASLVDSVINMIAIEYQDRALWGRPG